MIQRDAMQYKSPSLCSFFLVGASVEEGWFLTSLKRARAGQPWQWIQVPDELEVGNAAEAMKAPGGRVVGG